MSAPGGPHYRTDEPAVAGAADPENAPPEASIYTLLNVVLRRRMLVIGIAGLVGALIALQALTQPRTYSATARVVPELAGQGGAITGIAAQLGISGSAGDGTRSPQFYIDLLKSRELGRRVLATEVTTNVEGSPRRQTLLDLWGGGSATAGEKQVNAMATLHGSIAAAADSRTSVIALTVTTADPVLSHDVAKRLIELVIEFTQERQQTRARRERTFTERRLAEASSDLLAAENRLQAFLLGNRTFTSPTLEFQRERFMREVSFRQQIHNTLAEAHERAKIDEIRDSPVLTVIDPPELPVRANSRGTVRRTLAGILGGAFLGLFLALGVEFVSRSRTRGSGEYTEFRRLLDEMRDDLRSPGRLFRRRRRA